MKKFLDNLLFKILISIILIGFPGMIYHQFGFETGIITALCEIIFLVMATKEEITDLKDKIDVKK
jgi:hypothetical protein